MRLWENRLKKFKRSGGRGERQQNGEEYLNVCNEKFKSFVVGCWWVEHLVGATILLGQIYILPS